MFLLRMARKNTHISALELKKMRSMQLKKFTYMSYLLLTSTKVKKKKKYICKL